MFIKFLKRLQPLAPIDNVWLYICIIFRSTPLSKQFKIDALQCLFSYVLFIANPCSLPNEALVFFSIKASFFTFARRTHRILRGTHEKIEATKRKHTEIKKTSTWRIEHEKMENRNIFASLFDLLPYGVRISNGKKTHLYRIDCVSWIADAQNHSIYSSNHGNFRQTFFSFVIIIARRDEKIKILINNFIWWFAISFRGTNN